MENLLKNAHQPKLVILVRSHFSFAPNSEIKRISELKMLRHIVLSAGGQLDPRSIVKRDEVFTPVVYMDPTLDNGGNVKHANGREQSKKL